MREIKFRGLTANGKWVYGDLRHDLPGSTAYYKDYPTRICWHPESGGEANAPVKPETVGQYTGLKDDGGVDIYEGDVLSFEGDSERYIVNYGDGMFVVSNKCGLLLDYLNVFTNANVTGNIHEQEEPCND